MRCQRPCRGYRAWGVFAIPDIKVPAARSPPIAAKLPRCSRRNSIFCAFSSIRCQDPLSIFQRSSYMLISVGEIGERRAVGRARERTNERANRAASVREERANRDEGEKGTKRERGSSAGSYFALRAFGFLLSRGSWLGGTPLSSRRPFFRPLARMSLKSDLTRFFVSRPRLADRTRPREVGSADEIPATRCDSSRFHPCRQKRSGSRSSRADVFLRLFGDRFTHNRKTS